MGFLHKINRGFKKTFNKKNVRHFGNVLTKKVLPVLDSVGKELPGVLTAASLAAPQFSPVLLGAAAGISSAHAVGHDLGHKVHHAVTSHANHPVERLELMKPVLNHGLVKPILSKGKDKLRKKINKYAVKPHIY